MWIYTSLCLVFTTISAVHSEGTTTEPQPALWTTWGPWSLCSWPCGPGLRMRQRACVRRAGGRLARVDDPMECMGPTKEFVACTEGPCGATRQTPREVLCSERNNDLVHGHRFEWEPLSSAHNPCILTCMARGHSFYYDFGYVRDGTPCSDGGHLMCVSGRCLSVGCDGRVGSGATLDHCGVCGGDDIGCVHYQYNYTTRQSPDGRYGYKRVVKIPAGAKNITVREEGQNYLAVTDYNQTYVINGHWTLDWPGDFPLAGTVMTYTREDNSETIAVEGPTTEDINIMLMFRRENTGVYFEFYLPEFQLTELEHVTDRTTPTTTPSTTPTTPPTTTPTTTPMTTPTTITRTRPTDQAQNSTNNIHPDLIQKWFQQHLARTQSGSHSPGARPGPARHTGHSVHYFPQQDNQNPTVVRMRVTSSQGHRSASQAAPPRDPAFRDQHLPGQVPQRETRRHGNPFGFSRPAWCGSCAPPRRLAHHYCNSDFVTKVTITDFTYFGNETRYTTEVLDNYKDRVTLLNNEFIWVANRCRCPRLRINKDYILTGNLVEVGTRESRLEISATGYSKESTDRLEGKLRALQQRNSCETTS